MKIGDTMNRRRAVCKGQGKQSRMQQLAAAKQRGKHRRSLLRRSQPPRVLRSTRNISQRQTMQDQALFASVGRALRRS